MLRDQPRCAAPPHRNRAHASNILGILTRLRNKLNEYADEGVPIPTREVRDAA